MMMLRWTFFYWYLHYFLAWCYRLVNCPLFLQLHKLCFSGELAICQWPFSLKSFGKVPGLQLLGDFHEVFCYTHFHFAQVICLRFVVQFFWLHLFDFSSLTVWYKLVIGFLLCYANTNWKHWINWQPWSSAKHQEKWWIARWFFCGAVICEG